MHMKVLLPCILGVSVLNAAGFTIKRCGRDLKTGDFCMVPYCNGTCYDDVCVCPWEKKPFSLPAAMVNASTPKKVPSESSTATRPLKPQRPSSPPAETMPIQSPGPLTRDTSRLPGSATVEPTTQRMTTKFPRKKNPHHCKCHGR
ncbi:uncharacterized protein LOC142586903 [Dermacentor variabilis]|uniref:uncharacterized protein LOC142586903 n=1 Tax=Dermacentor variabilis TaxID=34621 RepID=UPI003F5B7DF6